MLSGVPQLKGLQEKAKLLAWQEVREPLWLEIEKPGAVSSLGTGPVSILRCFHASSQGRSTQRSSDPELPGCSQVLVEAEGWSPSCPWQHLQEDQRVLGSPPDGSCSIHRGQSGWMSALQRKVPQNPVPWTSPIDFPWKSKGGLLQIGSFPISSAFWRCWSSQFPHNTLQAQLIPCCGYTKGERDTENRSL